MSDLPEDFIEQIRKIARTDPKLAEWVKGLIADTPDIIEGRTIFGGDFRSIDLYAPVNPPTQEDEPVMGDGQGDGSGSLDKNRNKRGVDDDKNFGGPPGDDPSFKLNIAPRDADPFDDKHTGSKFLGLFKYVDRHFGIPIYVYLDGRFRKPPGWETLDKKSVENYPDYEKGWSWHFQGNANRYNSKQQLVLTAPYAGATQQTIDDMLEEKMTNPNLSMRLERWSTKYDDHDDYWKRKKLSYTKEAEYVVNANDNRYYSQKDMLESKTLAPYMYEIFLKINTGVRDNIYNSPQTLWTTPYLVGPDKGKPSQVQTSNIRTPQFAVGKVINIKADGKPAEKFESKDYDFGDPVPGDTPAQEEQEFKLTVLEMRDLLKKLRKGGLTNQEVKQIQERLKVLSRRNFVEMTGISAALAVITAIVAAPFAALAVQLTAGVATIAYAITVLTDFLEAGGNTRRKPTDILKEIEEAKKQHIADKAARDKAVKEQLARDKAKERAEARETAERVKKEMLRKADLDVLMSAKNVKWWCSGEGAGIYKIQRVNQDANVNLEKTGPDVDDDAEWELPYGQVIENNVRFQTHNRDTATIDIAKRGGDLYHDKIAIKLKHSPSGKIHTFELNAFNGITIINDTGQRAVFDAHGILL